MARSISQIAKLKSAQQFSKYANLLARLEEDVKVNKPELNIFLSLPKEEGDDEIKITRLLEGLRYKLFNRFSPNYFGSFKDNDFKIAKATSESYRFNAKTINFNLHKYLTADKYLEILSVIGNAEAIMSFINLNDGNESADNDKVFIKDLHYFTDLDKDDIQEAYEYFEKENKIVSVLDADSPIRADVIKLVDKYSIRIGDGKYFVASDEIKVVFRDPSSNPSWAVWFLGAVPLVNIPDRAVLLFLPEEERQKLYPKEMEDHPIICHASLWKLGKTTGVILHTSWNHMAATYRWKIDRPFEIASLLFKTVSHPCHLARNFGYTPTLRIPGDEWF